MGGAAGNRFCNGYTPVHSNPIWASVSGYVTSDCMFCADKPISHLREVMLCLDE